MDDNSIKTKTMEYTASRKNSFKWPVKDDILYYDTPKVLAPIQQPAPISDCFFRIKEHELEELLLQMYLGNKDPWYSFKQNIFNFPKFSQYNFINPLFHNVAKWSNILSKSYRVFFNIMK